MTGPQPPEPPISPQFGLPPMSQVPPGAFDNPEDRRKRMRLGLLGGGIGLGIDVVIVVVALLTGTAASEFGSGAQWILLAGTILAAPIQIIAGIVLAAVQSTRPFGVGFLIGSAIGAIIMAGACFAPLVATS